MDFKGTNLGLGFSVLSILCAVCGKWLAVPPLRVRRSSWEYWALQAYSYLFTALNMLSSLLVVAMCFLVQQNIPSNFALPLYLVCGASIQLECTLRAFFMHCSKVKVERLVTSLDKLLAEDKMRRYKRLLLPRLTRYVLVLLSLFFTTYLVALVTNFVSCSRLLQQPNHNSSLHLSQLFTTQRDCVITYVMFFLSLGLVVSTDVLFYCLYWLAVEQSRVLNKMLATSLTDVRWWLSKHQQWTR